MPPSNPLLHRVIRETGWTYEALARRLNTSARAAGLTTAYDRTAVAHWLRGSTPRDPVPGLLCEILSGRLGRPVDPEDIGMGHTVPTGPTTAAAELLAGVPGLQPHRRHRPGPDGPGAPERDGHRVPEREDHRVPEQRDRPAPVPGAHAPALPRTGLRRAAEDFFTVQVDALGGDATAPVLLAYLQSTFHAVLGTGGEGALPPRTGPRRAPPPWSRRSSRPRPPTSTLPWGSGTRRSPGWRPRTASRAAPARTPTPSTRTGPPPCTSNAASCWAPSRPDRLSRNGRSC
ncbi:hypothetical protein ACFWSF_21090 [Streptomyces sp. NPDC058611]|uniref:hypothetical protein n=1 Tax=unclassified Streptomyces TaxID=2593676 RepID=UPI003666F9C6